ncbi:hypothetical protein Ddye_003244 [Dipteronia dyeriana]|uniref:Uncharacterized protein n=1 Tax=Dipteronia dyeriana TaxID=168575 RepID=A0AAD9XSN1_9ROSI|nr:hypothetical protein Ddye_003244 [Dipteronia dyeriana]
MLKPEIVCGSGSDYFPGMGVGRGEISASESRLLRCSGTSTSYWVMHGNTTIQAKPFGSGNCPRGTKEFWGSNHKTLKFIKLIKMQNTYFVKVLFFVVGQAVLHSG